MRVLDLLAVGLAKTRMAYLLLVLLLGLNAFIFLVTPTFAMADEQTNIDEEGYSSLVSADASENSIMMLSDEFCFIDKRAFFVNKDVSVHGIGDCVWQYNYIKQGYRDEYQPTKYTLYKVIDGVTDYSNPLDSYKIPDPGNASILSQDWTIRISTPGEYRLVCNFYCYYYTSSGGNASDLGGSDLRKDTKSEVFKIVPNTYTISFDNNGSAVTQKLKPGSYLENMPKPTNKGYKFMGWFTSKTGGTQATEFTKVAKDVIYYAQWDQDASSFTDVNKSQWYYKEGYIEYVVKEGLMSGYNGTQLFGTYDNITRGQVATILYRRHMHMTAENTNNNVTTRFSDVPAGQYYSAAVKWAADKGIAAGYSGTDRFGPNNPITRAELATMLHRFAAWRTGDGSAASDEAFYATIDISDVPAWAKDALIWTSYKGILSGRDTPEGKVLAPNDYAARCEMAKMITVLARDVLSIK